MWKYIQHSTSTILNRSRDDMSNTYLFVYAQVLLLMIMHALYTNMCITVAAAGNHRFALTSIACHDNMHAKHHMTAKLSMEFANYCGFRLGLQLEYSNA